MLSLHLITYVVRVLKALRYWVKESRQQLLDGTSPQKDVLNGFRTENYNLTLCGFSPQIRLFCGPIAELKTTDPIFEDFERDLDLLQASGMDFVFIALTRNLLREANIISKQESPNISVFINAYQKNEDFKEFVELSSGFMAAFYIDWMTQQNNRKKSKYPHGNSSYWKVLEKNFWNDINNPEVSNLEVLLSLIEKHNATRKSDRETSFSWKSAYYRQFKEAGSIIQEIKRGRRSAIGYLATDEFITLSVHLAAIQNNRVLTLEQYESYLNKRGIYISNNKKDSDINRLHLKKRLKELGMFETVSDSKEAQFIRTIYI